MAQLTFYNGVQIARSLGKRLPLYLPVDRWTDHLREGGTAERVFRCFTHRWKLDVPRLGSRHPNSYLHILVERDISQIRTLPVVSDAILHYEWDLQAAVPDDYALPDDVVDEYGTSVDVPIEQHPKFNDEAVFPEADKSYDPKTGLFLGFKSTSPWFGHTKFYAGTKSATVTTFGRTPFDEQDDKMCKVSDPGHGLKGEGKWLYLTYHRGKQGIFFTLTVTYIFGSLGWPSYYAAVEE